VSTFLNTQSRLGRGAARLNFAERAALRAYLARLGYREAVRTLGVGRSTLTAAVLGGSMRNSTAFLLRAALAGQSTQPEVQP
jgi:hypothetical protein